MSIFRAVTQSFKDSKGNVKKDSIAEMRMVPIFDTKQFVLIRGENKYNPVLLILHGGPGLSETPLFRFYNSQLERHFVVVYWDQRACGKSYTKQAANGPLSIQMFVDDIHELTIYLRREFHQEKIFLLGHSWGTIIGTMAAYQYPELFYAYIGTGQVSSMPDGELESYHFVCKAAAEQQNNKALDELKMIGEPQNGLYSCGIKGTKIQRKWLTYFGGALYGEKSWNRFRNIILKSKEYNLFDIIKLFKAMNAPSRNRMSENEFLKTDLTRTIRSLEIPIYFFLGRHDYQVPSIVAERYFNELKAHKKELVWFENSAHSPCFEESEKFNRLIIEKALPENYTTCSTVDCA